MIQDLRFALRLLRRAPGFTLAAVATLALGIGPTAAVFSLTDALGLRPLPVERPDELTAVFTGTGERADGRSSYPDYLDLAAGVPAFRGLAAYGTRGVALTGGNDLPGVSIVQVVSPNFFELLGVRAAVGRCFMAADRTAPGWPAVAVVSEELWRRRFGGRPDAVGGPIELNGQAFTLAGVAPAEFHGVQPLTAPGVWIPAEGWALLLHGDRRELEARDNRWFDLVGRLAPGATLDTARSEVAVVGRRLTQAYPSTNRDRRATVVPEAEARGRAAGLVRLLLLAGVGLVLALGCANVAGLLTARAETRRRELAVRAALGGGRARLLRLLFGESALLAAGAMLAGLATGYWLIHLLPTLMPPTPLPIDVDLKLDARVVGFTALAAVVTVVAFGSLPGIAASRPDLVPLLKGGTTAGPTARRISTRDVLVVAQIALTLVLLATAGLFVRGLQRMQHVDPGFDEGPMVLLTLAPGITERGVQGLVEYQHALVARAAAVPGVTRACVARRMPLSPFGGGARQVVMIPGRTPPSGEKAFRIPFNAISPGYFTTLGVRMLRGRAFTARDGWSNAKVAVISDAMARRFWPDRDPLGATIDVGDAAEPHTIVGVAADGKYNDLLEAAEPFLYLAIDQHPPSELTLLVRPSTDERQVAAALRQAVTEVDRAVPALQMLTMRDHLRFALLAPLTISVLAGCLGAVGLVLAVVGLYAVVAHAVGRRTREFGVRLALGASPRRLVASVLARGLALGAAGLGLGIAVMLAAGPAAAGLLFGVSPRDPLALAGASALLLAVTLAAAWIPARQAARVDPMTALRAE